ncbi:MAG: 6-phosphofructokinase, partial [Clostridia bacterium]|nr:6-phosphofructokinase [Clostridia bacterium]
MLKGNAIVGQSGGPTAAINATLAGVIEGAFGSEAIGTIYGAFNGIDGILEERICDLGERIRGEDDLKALANTPAAALGSCRKKLPEPDKDPDVYKKIFDFFKKYDIRYFFYIGGNDSMDTVAKLSAYSATNDYEIRVMGVPKTIDNDVMGTDHTPGYGSAAKFIAVSMAEMLRDCAVYTV